MLIILLLTIVLYLFSLKQNKNETFLSVESTKSLLGLCTIIIFLSHIQEYIVLSNAADFAFQKILRYIGQTMVVPFFYFSGYGIQLSAILKGRDYINKFILKRFLPVWLSFSMAILIYYLFNILNNSFIDLKVVLISLTGWESIGNSNWFMFATFYIYLCFYLSNVLFKNSKVFSVILLHLLCFLYIIVVSKFKDPFFYNTILAFPVGALVAILKDYIKRNSTKFLLFLSIIFIISILLRRIMIFYQIYNIVLMLFFTVITLKVEFKNNLLIKFANYSFYIYIYQRLVFSVLTKFGLNTISSSIFTIASFIVTIGISMIMSKLNVKVVDKILSENDNLYSK